MTQTSTYFHKTDRRQFILGASALCFPSSRALADQTETTPPFSRTNHYASYLQSLLSRPKKGDEYYSAASFVSSEEMALRWRAKEHQESLGAQAEARDALETVKTVATDYRVILLNEAHYCSRHRMFLNDILSELYPLHFRWLAAETFLSEWPEPNRYLQEFQRTGYLSPFAGWYLRDPVYAEALRAAREKGYSFIAYERTKRQDKVDADTTERIELRERSQANNLATQIKNIPRGEKILVYTGFGHVREHRLPGAFRTLAMRLSELLGEDILTIEQAKTGSMGPHGTDHTLCRSIMQRFDPSSPICVRQGNQWLGSRQAETDIAVFHPNKPDMFGRPFWLKRPDRKRVPVPLHLSDEGPHIVQAVRRDEPEFAIPSDQVFCRPGTAEVSLWLPKGTFRIQIECPKGVLRLSETLSVSL